MAPPAATSAAGSAVAACPFADLQRTFAPDKPPEGCPFHAHKPFVEADVKITGTVPVALRGNTHVVSKGSEDLLLDIGGGDRIREFCTRFYTRMHIDTHLQQFLFLDDGPVAHAKRLADWIIEKMGGEGKPWTDSGRYGMRQPSHHQAWNNPKRHRSVIGDHFQLDDTRVWMRLHFWAARESGLDKHPAFWDWYKGFIGHFIRVYERRAPPYVEESAAWSADPANIAVYLKDLRMHDVIGIGRG